MFRNFGKISFVDKTLNRFQDVIYDTFSYFSDKKIVDGYTQTVNLVAGTNKVYHKLGRVYTGYIVIGKNGNVNVWDSTSTDPSSFINIQSAGTVTVTLWIF